LRNRIAHGLQLLTVPVSDDLHRILVEPARRAGYEFEDPELPAEMVAEVADQAGALALISFTASKLWELRDRHFRQLTRSAYRALGGVGGALARHAEVTLDAMPPEQRALAREAFRHLVTTQNTRAVLTGNDLRELLGDTAHADRVIESLVTARLLVAAENEAGAETIEIIHEALLAAWPRLAHWQREDADGARFREQLRAAAAQWDERGRAKGLLWRGDALADFTRWRARHEGRLTIVEQAFTDASLADAARSRRNRRIALATAFSSLVAVVIALAAFNARVTGQRERAEAARNELLDNVRRQYEDQGRRLVLGGDPLLGLAYLKKAAEMGASGRAHDFLVSQAIRATDGEVFEVRHDGLPARQPRFSHDGSRLATTALALNSRVHVWDAATGAPLFALEHKGEVKTSEFAPDDRTLLTASDDHTSVLWDAVSGKPLRTFRHPAAVACAMYSADAKLVITAAQDNEVRLWRLDSGDLSTGFAARGKSDIRACALSPDGAQLVIGRANSTAQIWELTTGRLVHELAAGPSNTSGTGVKSIRFFDDGARVMTATDRDVMIWSVATGSIERVLPVEGEIQHAEPSPDGRAIASASSSGVATVWNARTGTRELVLAGHASGVQTVAFSPDGRYIVTASQDTTVWLWDRATGHVAARWRGHRDAVQGAVFDPRSERVATASDDGTAIVWDVRAREHTIWLATPGRAVSAALFSPDGKRVVTSDDDSVVRVYDAESGRLLGALRGHQQGWVHFAAFSPNGKQIASGGDDHTVLIWDADTGVLLATLSVSGPVSQVAWSPDGELLAASVEDGSLYCWDRPSGRQRFVRRPLRNRRMRSVAFDRQGKRIVTSGDDRVIRLWDRDGVELPGVPDLESSLHLSAEFDDSGNRLLIAYAKQTARIVRLDRFALPSVRLDGHVGFIGYATWSPDGTMALTSSMDGTARLWDAETGAMLATYRHVSNVSVATFSPDGSRIVVADYAGQVSVHELPVYRATPEQRARLLRCRLRHEVTENGVVPRERDLSACAGE
jgi:WD40 repeat protein